MRNLVRNFVHTRIESVVTTHLEKRLPSLIEEVLLEKFKENPSKPLSCVGFNWALALSLKEFWPDVSNAEAVAWLNEYTGVPYGTDGHDWSYAGAKDIAREYVNEVWEIH